MIAHCLYIGDDYVLYFSILVEGEGFRVKTGQDPTVTEVSADNLNIEFREGYSRSKLVRLGNIADIIGDKEYLYTSFYEENSSICDAAYQIPVKGCGIEWIELESGTDIALWCDTEGYDENTVSKCDNIVGELSVTDIEKEENETGDYAGWKTYTNSTFNVRLRYPNDWELIEDQSTEDHTLGLRIINGGGYTLEYSIGDGSPDVCVFSDTDVSGIPEENRGEVHTDYYEFSNGEMTYRRYYSDAYDTTIIYVKESLHQIILYIGNGKAQHSTRFLLAHLTRRLLRLWT